MRCNLEMRKKLEKELKFGTGVEGTGGGGSWRCGGIGNYAKNVQKCQGLAKAGRVLGLVDGLMFGTEKG